MHILFFYIGNTVSRRIWGICRY